MTKQGSVRRGIAFRNSPRGRDAPRTRKRPRVRSIHGPNDREPADPVADEANYPPAPVLIFASILPKSVANKYDRLRTPRSSAG
jgi:hypothetical protein